MSWFKKDKVVDHSNPEYDGELKTITIIKRNGKNKIFNDVVDYLTVGHSLTLWYADGQVETKSLSDNDWIDTGMGLQFGVKML